MYDHPFIRAYVMRLLRDELHSQWSIDWPSFSANWLNYIGRESTLTSVCRTILYLRNIPFPRTLMTDLGTLSVSQIFKLSSRLLWSGRTNVWMQVAGAQWVQRGANFNLFGPYLLLFGSEFTHLIWWCSSPRLGVAGSGKSRYRDSGKFSRSTLTPLAVCRLFFEP